MKGAILYFSLTGNTKLACEYIKGKVQNVDFDLLDMRGGVYDLNKYDIVGFASFADEYNIARFVRSYIENMSIVNKPAFVFSTFGQENGATTKNMAEEISNKGFKVVIDHSLHTPENYPPVIKHSHGFINHPNTIEIDEFNIFINDLTEICEKIKNNETVSEKKVEASFKYNILTKLTGPKMMRTIMGRKKVNDELCVQCKKCVSNCPYNAIKMDSFPVFDESKCHGCFACYNLCPTKAIYTKGYNQNFHYPKPNKAVIQKLKI